VVKKYEPLTGEEHEKVPSAGEVGESKKHQFWLREERGRSETFTCMVNTYEIIFCTPRVYFLQFSLFLNFQNDYANEA